MLHIYFFFATQIGGNINSSFLDHAGDAIQCSPPNHTTVTSTKPMTGFKFIHNPGSGRSGSIECHTPVLHPGLWRSRYIWGLPDEYLLALTDLFVAVVIKTVSFVMKLIVTLLDLTVKW